MSDKLLNSIPITRGDMVAQKKEADNIINSVSQSVKPEINKNDASAYSRSLEPVEESVSISALVHAIDKDDDLLSEAQLHTLRAIRTAFQVARHIAEDYGIRSGIPGKGQATTGFTPIQQTEISEKKQTSAAIALFVAARYLVWNMQSIVDGNAFLESVNVVVNEVDISRLVPSLRCGAFYLGKNIEKEAHGDEARLAAIVYKYAELLQQEIIDRVGSLKHTGFFTDITYQLEDSDFIVSGFELMALSHETVEVREVYPDEIIGNTVSLAGIEDALRKLFCYDIKTQTNPIKKYGGFEEARLLSGYPGNGKTEILCVARTLARDYAEASGLPYQDLVVPNMVSKMQGESTDLARAFLKKLFDPNSINLGIGDEFEVVLPNHGNDNISEGDKKVAVEFLKMFSGVGSINRLNYLFLAATNFPENIDPAFLSRLKARDYITGAETIDDYIRFIILTLRKLNQLHPGIINLKNVDWKRNIREALKEDDSHARIDPTMSVHQIREVALKHHDRDDIRFFATFFYLMKKRQNTFSLRDCANTIGGAKGHVAGFKIPMEWIAERKHYVDQDLVHKDGLLADLATQHVKTSGVSFVEILDQKAVYYAEESLRMAETERQRAVEEYAEKRVIQHLGEKAFNAKMEIVH